MLRNSLTFISNVIFVLLSIVCTNDMSQHQSIPPH